MQLIVLKDGTIPMAVAKVVATDGDLMQFQSEELADEAREYVEVFEVKDTTTYVLVGWSEFNGFDVSGYASLDYALFDLMQDTSETPEVLEEGRHWVVTYNPGENESYGHVFAIGEEQR